MAMLALFFTGTVLLLNFTSGVLSNPECTDPSSCVRTSGCQDALLSRSLSDAEGQLPVTQYPIDLVIALVEEFKHRLLRLVETMQVASSTWNISGLAVQVPHWGLRELNPVRHQSVSLVDTSPRHVHRALRETRWWITSLESHLQMTESCGLLGPIQGRRLVEDVHRTSSNLNHLLRTFFDTHDNLPEQALCREYDQNQMTDSVTERAKFTSLVLRDTLIALEHIVRVVSSCTVQPHHSGPHRVRLSCSTPSHVFYSHRHVPGNRDYWIDNPLFMD